MAELDVYESLIGLNFRDTMNSMSRIDNPTLVNAK